MKKMLALATSFTLAGMFAAANPASAAVFVVAHPDDDILMMGANLLTDIKGNYKTVIIVVTAGDAGNGAAPIAPGYTADTATSFNTGTTPYYRVRLNARLNALAQWIPASYPRPWQVTTEAFGPYFNGQPTYVEKATLGNVIEYHINLPDQFEGNQYTTIENLNNTSGATGDYYAYDVTGKNVYNVHSLREIVRQIIKRNFPSEPNLVINFQEPAWRNSAYQPVPRMHASATDHLDHTAVGKMVKDAIAGVPAYYCMTEAIYYGYVQAANLPSPNFPNAINDQRIGYEALHQTLSTQGNIIPFYPGDAISGGTWGTTQVYTPTSSGQQRQRGAMDGFHRSFYGKQIWYGIPSNGPCNLGANG